MTTKIRHHLTDALLMGYSAGTLPEGFSLLVASHISMCDECRARMHAFDAVGGAMLDDAAGETDALDEDSFAATLRLIEMSDSEAPTPRAPAPGQGSVLPAPLRDYVGGDVDAIRWRRVGGGIKDCVLVDHGAAVARLLYIPGGQAVPDHGHSGTELTLVLSGAFHDEVDHFGAGDVEVADEELDHTPVAVEGAPCICLAATDAPLRFRGLLPRLAQKFMRI